MVSDFASIDFFSRDVLEFPSILALLRPFLSGPISHPALSLVQPRTDLPSIQRDLELTREAGEYLNARPRPTLATLGDPRQVLERLSVEGAVCAALEILAVVEVAKAACEWRQLFGDGGRLDDFAQNIADLRDLVNELDGKILPDGSVDSSASPALARIRRSIERIEREIESRLQRLLHRLSQEQLLQEELITLRNGRYVLPVRAEKKRQVEGIVHGTSSSGASLYVEPLETLPLNNELVELQDREEAEVRRILGEFSERLRARREELLSAAAILGELDLTFAKAEFARQYRASIPRFIPSREIVLRDARHPLLENVLRAASGRAPVPMTIELREPQTLVIISGPNTGGKTVALKTVGSIALMAQAGLPVLAKEARLPLFERVLADIGDQQSIEQNLSTFSAHIRNIQAMAQAADHNDLVLLDEIGSSTDPQEGAALAVAILERFRKRGSITFASTHHGRLKAYAAETPAALNAAMDFDETTLQPTYRFLTGLPGKSSGIEIAQRTGLDSAIVEQARSLLDPAEKEVSSLIASLHAQHAEGEAALARLREEARAMEARQAEMKQQWNVERHARLRELDRRFEQTLREYDKKWNASIAEIRKQALAQAKPAKALGNTDRRGDRLTNEAREEWNLQVLETLGTPATAVPEPALPGSAAVGDRVRLKGLSEPGVVTSVLSDGQIEVEVGRLRMRTRNEDVTLLSPGVADAARFTAKPPAAESEAGTEINVIGNSAEEARERVDEFLDRAYLAGRYTLRVVHGHGKGILRKSLHEMFATHPHVERFHTAPRHEGGEGATIVELKR